MSEIRLTLLGQVWRKLLCLILGHWWHPAVHQELLYREEGRVCMRCLKRVWDRKIWQS